jgi:hypothetical protein
VLLIAQVLACGSLECIRFTRQIADARSDGFGIMLFGDEARRPRREPSSESLSVAIRNAAATRSELSAMSSWSRR